MSGEPDPTTDPYASEHGQVLPLMALLCTLGVAAALVVGHIGVVLDERARASTAADAAALAGVVEGRSGAASLARAHGGTLEHFERDGADTVVVVRIGRARAEARARAETRSLTRFEARAAFGGWGASLGPAAPRGGGHPVHSTIVLRSSHP